MLRLFILMSGILFANGSSFEERLKILEVEMDLLKQANIELKRENLELNHDNTELKSRVKELEVDVSGLKGEDMHNNLSYESHINAAMHETIDSINKSRKLETSDWHDTPNFQNDQNPDAIASLSKKEILQSGRVAFHVYLSSSKCFNNFQVIEYDTEVLDTGNGYNEHDGIYIVPESGIYVFTWTFIADYSEYAVNEIVINGAAKGWTISDGSGHCILRSPSSGLILASVNAGDHVFIRRVTGHGCMVYSSTFGQPTFSGWQLS
ncbi:uncharacterized protein LOC132734917 [Ruditapes philippinarum]|uniref:uncharacterized protein LOC132734917 n=1 Tax=Ruditapes philippinarum TaxID=129788 RepID=UPI00295BE48D|nr:uncharacterized protein LOC132734917 [Ruditapes philippinarum]